MNFYIEKVTQGFCLYQLAGVYSQCIHSYVEEQSI